MKKIYSVALMLAFFSQVDAQVLNQSAGWPSTAWTITGTFNSDPAAFEADPTTTANFAFDDDDAGGSSDDDIAVESPVIDLSAAFAANEKSLEIAVSYGYYFLEDDVLQFQYWDATAAAWVAWPGSNIPGTGTSVTDDFCLLPKVAYVSDALDISGFSPAQLTGFKYRIYYNDNVDGADWNYGFCFESPTIRSLGCAPTSGILVEDVTTESADISWSANAGSGFEIIIDEVAGDPTVAGTPTTDLSYSAGGLTPSTTYYVHIRTNCGGTFSLWRTVSFRTPAVAPTNDACADAIVISGFPYENAQDASAATNNDGYIEVCDNTMNDGVWYSFTGDGSELQIRLNEVVGWDPQLDIYEGTCGSFNCVASADGGGTGDGEEIVFTSIAGTTYYINVGHYSGFGDNPEGPFSISVESFVAPEPPANDACADAIVISGFPYTNSQDAEAATNNDGFVEACENTMNDGVWYTFTGDGSELRVLLSDLSSWDAELGIYSGSCGSFTCVASVDDSGTGGDEEYIFTSEVGTTYYVNVGHYSGTENEDEGEFTLSVETYEAPVAPENDSCATAVAIASFPYNNSQDATAATNNDGVIEACENGMNDGVWYTFTGDGSDITVTISNVGDWDPQLGIYTGSCGEFNCVDTIDDAGSAGEETLTVLASENGVTYYVNVGHYSGFGDEEEGTFDIAVTSSALATSSFTNANFKSYPNPVKDVLHLSYTKNITDVTVFNMLGQQVLAKSLNVTNGQVDLSSLNNGTYMVKVASGKESKTIKVIKL